MTQRSDAHTRRVNKCIEALKERRGTRLDEMAVDEGMREAHAEEIHFNDMTFVALKHAVIAAFGKNAADQVEGLVAVLAQHACNLATAKAKESRRKDSAVA